MMHDRRGFTIVELMVATTAFSVILLVLTAGILQIGKTYQKGVTQSKTLNATRAIIDEVAQTIQFAGGDIYGPIESALTPPSDSVAYCIGGRLFSYVAGVQLSQANHVLVSQPVSTCSGVVPQELPNGATGSNLTEYLGERMRLSKFIIEKQPNVDLYKITVRIIYGDDDLLCRSTEAGECASNTVLTADVLRSDADVLACKDISSGSQFCATSELTTTVERRLRT